MKFLRFKFFTPAQNMSAENFFGNQRSLRSQQIGGFCVRGGFSFADQKHDRAVDQIGNRSDAGGRRVAMSRRVDAPDDRTRSAAEERIRRFRDEHCNEIGAGIPHESEKNRGVDRRAHRSDAFRAHRNCRCRFHEFLSQADGDLRSLQIDIRRGRAVRATREQKSTADSNRIRECKSDRTFACRAWARRGERLGNRQHSPRGGLRCAGGVLHQRLRQSDEQPREVCRREISGIARAEG